MVVLVLVDVGATVVVGFLVEVTSVVVVVVVVGAGGFGMAIVQVMPQTSI